jgi:PAS domain S-box-containing protein
MHHPYQDYFDALPCYVTIQDLEFNLVAANRRFREDFGEIDGRTCYQVYKHRPEPCETCPVARTFQDGQPHTTPSEVKSLDGRDISVIVYTNPLRNGEGKITSVMKLSTDITEVKRLERQLKQSQERHRLIFEEVPCYISIQDRDFRILNANRRFREDFCDDCLGKKCYEVYKHRKEACLSCPVQAVFDDGQMHTSEEVVTSRDGRTINVMVNAAPLYDSKGRIESVMEMSANITEIRHLQSQLTSIGMLISSISHGIKGQLSGLSGGMYMLETGLKKDDRGRLQKGWEMVRRNVGRIHNSVLDILYYAKDRKIDWEPLESCVVAGDVFELMETKAAELGIELHRDIDPEAGIFDGDAKAVRSLLTNLVENSLDACRVDTKKKEHRVSIAVAGEPRHIRFEVSDNGIGMDQEARDKAFTLFFSSKGTEGTGLGLFIANKITNAHGGSIRLESEVDKGTRFIVKLPRTRPAS